MKSNTTKYLIIAGVIGVGYYLYSRSQSSVALPGSSSVPVNAADLAFVQSWATGLTGSNSVNFNNALPTLSAADVSQLASLIKAWEGLRALNDSDYTFWSNFQQRVGLV